MPLVGAQGGGKGLEMLLRSVERGGYGWPRVPALLLITALSAGCSIAGFGGALQLNITDLQSRDLTIRVVGSTGDARLVEINNDAESEIGRGTAEIDRYVLQRATFGRGAAVGFFLCPKPCPAPLDAFLAAYSPDQLFAPTGELQLRFRIEPSDGVTAEISHTITAEMLPSLWQEPVVEVGSGLAR